MNSFIENLNQSGGAFLNFAWPMLWQSSLLIVILFMVDVMFRRKIRASIRYALWLAVLVKLCLPPALALPTGAAWWLFPNQAAARRPAIPKYVVTYGTTAPLTDFVPATMPAAVPPSPRLDGAGWVLLGCGLMSAGLLLWLASRWWQISRKVGSATPSEEFASLLDETRRRAGVRLPLRLKLIPGRMSPAVCGLCRPVILLPRVLTEQLSAGQLRAVLLHEAFHLRRQDVWVNCAQALLQIVYWWHPLLWLANARIRRLREEAVDDAVMLTLQSEAENYAPTLLAVAKLALSRPLMSLGLVGIMESRSALHQRIERLVNFRPGRKAGLTFVSFCCICAFSAVALPMGEAPGPAEKLNSTDAAVVEPQALTLKVNPGIFIQNVKAQAAQSLLSPTNDYTVILLDLLRGEGVDCGPSNGIAFNRLTGEITTQNTPARLEIFRRVIEQLNRADGICELPLGDNPLRKRLVVIEARIYQMPAADVDDFVSDLQFYHSSPGGDDWWSASPEKFRQLVSRLGASGLRLIQRPRIQTGSGITTEFFIGNGTNSVDFDCKPYVADGFVDLALQGTVIGVTPARAAFTNYFRARASAENGGGIVVRVKNYGSDANNNLVAVIGVEIITNTVHFQERLQATVPDKAASANGLVSEAKVLYEMGKFDEAEKRLKSALALDSENGAAKYYLELVQAARQASGIIQTGSGRKEIVAKLNQIHLERFGPFDGLTLGQVLQNLNEAVKQQGVRLTIASDSNSGPVPTDPAIGLPVKQTELTTADARSVTIHLFPAMENVSLQDALNAVTSGASRPVKFSIQEDGVVFSEGASDAVMLFSRTFQVNASAFANAARNIPGLQTNSVSAMARSLFSKCGVDLKPPESVFYTDRLGLLFVRATMQDLDTIERAIQALNLVAPQIHIKARFLKVPKGTLNGFGFAKIIGITNQPDELVGILTRENAAVTIRMLESQPGIEELAEPEVTTSSGRQTQMRATQIITVITNFVFAENSYTQSNSITPQSTKVETGPILDVVPYALSDGYTILLTVIPSLTEFLGYDKTTNTAVVYNKAGEKIDLPTISPALRTRHAMATLRLWDGQTVVLCGMKTRFYDGGKEVGTEPDYFLKTKAARGQPNEEDKDVLVLITVTLVDPAGNRIHSDDEMPFAKGAIPPQDDPVSRPQ